MKIAFIITGDVRHCPTKNLLPNKLIGCDVFCGSYFEHSDYLDEFGSNNICINKQTIQPPFGLHSNDMQQNMLQWLCLDLVIKTYKNKLLLYDVICKIRFDTILHHWHNYGDYILSRKIEKNILYNDSDRVFFATTDTFVNCFDDFYNTVIPRTFVRHKNHSFANSWKSEDEFQKNLHNKDIQTISIDNDVSIDRGTHKKTFGDSNKKLYSTSGELFGKFTI